MPDYQRPSTYETSRLGKLEQFFKEVSILTMFHDVIGDNAVVFPSKLGPALEKVDPEWWRKVNA